MYKVDVGHRVHKADAGIRSITPGMFCFVSFVSRFIISLCDMHAFHIRAKVRKVHNRIVQPVRNVRKMPRCIKCDGVL